MPYIKEKDREALQNGKSPDSPGELNYVITDIVDKYLTERGGVRYALINEAIGALECAKLELYRRLAAPYEDEKIKENGDVYRAREGEGNGQ